MTSAQMRFSMAIRSIFPKVPARTLDFMAWNMTAYPFNGPSGFLAQLAEIRNECGPDHKRGFVRKLHRMARRIDDDMRKELLKQYAEPRDGQ